MPEITKTRQIAEQCYAVVRMTCPPDLKGWDRHLFKFFQQVGGIYFSDTDPALHFTDGSLRDGNKVMKRIDGHLCSFEFYLVKTHAATTTIESLRDGREKDRLLYPR